MNERCTGQEPFQEVMEGEIAREGFYRAGDTVTILNGEEASVSRQCELRTGHDGEHRYEW